MDSTCHLGTREPPQKNSLASRVTRWARMLWDVVFFGEFKSYMEKASTLGQERARNTPRVDVKGIRATTPPGSHTLHAEAGQKPGGLAAADASATGRSKTTTDDDPPATGFKLPQLWAGDDAAPWNQRLTEAFALYAATQTQGNGEPQRPRLRILRALIRTFKVQILGITALKLARVQLDVRCAVIMRSLLQSLARGEKTAPSAVLVLGLCLIVLELMGIFMDAHTKFWEKRCQLRMRAALSTCLFDKLFLKQYAGNNWARSNLRGVTAGDRARRVSQFTGEGRPSVYQEEAFADYAESACAPINTYNLLSTDIPYVVGLVWRGIDCVLYPVTAWLSFRVLYAQIGLASNAGLYVLLFVVLAVCLLEWVMVRLKPRYLAERDQRLHKTEEMVHNAQLIRLLGWRTEVAKAVTSAREGEMSVRSVRMFLFGIASALAVSAKSYIEMAVFTSLVFSSVEGDGQLSPSTAIPAAHLIAKLASPLTRLAFFASGLAESFVALRRYEQAIFPASEGMNKRGSGEVGSGSSTNASSASDCSATDDAKSATRSRGSTCDSVTAMEVLPLLGEMSPEDSPRQLIFGERQQLNSGYGDRKCGSRRRTSLLSRREKGISALTTAPGTSLLPARIVDVRNARFVWSRGAVEENSAFVLHIPRLSVREGECVIVLGRSGSGKTALIHALLQELFLIEGTVSCSAGLPAKSIGLESALGSDIIAFSSEQPWISAATVRELILCGRPYVPEAYNAVLRACALLSDLEQWGEDRDYHRVASGGASLSGGQRARISLARALYALPVNNARLCLLDAPFSACDPHVGAYIFTQLVCHGMIKRAATIITLDKENLAFFLDEIRSRDLNLAVTLHIMEMTNGILNNTSLGFPRVLRPPVTGETVLSVVGGSEALVNEAGGNLRPNRSHSESNQVTLPFIVDQPENRLSISEMAARFYPPSGNFRWYASRVGGLTLCCMLLLIAVVEVSTVLASCWLTYWTATAQDLENGPFPDTWKAWNCYSIMVYVCLLACSGAGLLALNTVQIAGCLKAARQIHCEIIRGFMSLPYQMYQRLSFGGFISRLATDLHSVDSNVLYSVCVCIGSSVALLSTVVALCIASPLCFPLVPFLTWAMYSTVYKYNKPSARIFQTIKLLSLTPLCGNFNDVSMGVSVIRALGVTCLYRDRNKEAIRTFCRSEFLQMGSRAFSALVMELIVFPFTILNTLGPAVVAYCGWSLELKLITNSFSFRGGSNEQSAVLRMALIGFGISLALGLPRLIRSVIWGSIDMDLDMCSVERVRELCTLSNDDNPDQKKGEQRLSAVVVEFDTTSDTSRVQAPLEEQRPVLELRDATVGYEEPEKDIFVYGLTPLYGALFSSKKKFSSSLKCCGLLRFTASIYPGQHIGVIGRTGAGKSTLLLAMRNLLPLIEGSIMLDGKPLACRTTEWTEQHIGVVPQMPFVLKGWTVRRCLDPENNFTTTQLLNVLKLLNMAQLIQNLPCGLETVIVPDGIKKEVTKHSDTSQQNPHCRCPPRQRCLADSHIRLLAVARLALHADRYRLILIDEPPICERTVERQWNEGLDGENSLSAALSGGAVDNTEMSQILKRLFPRTAAVIVTHYAMTIQNCDVVWVLSSGRLVQVVSGTTIPSQRRLMEYVAQAQAEQEKNAATTAIMV